MEILLLLLLVVGAAVIFLPEVFREKALDSPLDTVSDFRRGMTALALSAEGYESNMNRHYGYQPRTHNEPEPYVRRNDYGGTWEAEEREIVPYPSNRSRVQMEVRRQRIMIAFLMIALATGIVALVPSLDWMLPVHIAILVIFAAYSLLVVLLPHQNRYR